MLTALVVAAHFAAPLELRSFLRGNTHTHSLRSDGDSAPEKVIAWYRDHGYQFLVLTDHNLASKPREFASLETPGFRVVPGEEVSYAYGTKQKPVSVHVNALCASASIGGKLMNPAQAALRDAISQVVAQPGAVAQINHPNYEWAFTAADLVAAGEGASLVEIANQHPFVRNEGDAKHPPVEALWDAALTAGRRLWGVASDDMHDLVRNPGYEPRRPGQGWVQVAAAENSDEAICSALAEGRFYSSTGVELRAIVVDGARLSLELPESGRYRTDFIGSGGAKLGSVEGARPFYELRGGEGYVRAVVTDLARPQAQAWVQPAWEAPQGSPSSP